MNPRLPKILFLSILLAAIAESIRNFALLPDRVASHFASSGAANGWMTKSQFFELNFGMTALAAAIGFLIPRVIAWVPTSLINLPNREYWLAPERRAHTLAILAKYFAWFACGLLLLEVCVMQFVIESNLQPTARLATGPFLFLISVFVAFTFAWSIAILRRFSKRE